MKIFIWNCQGAASKKFLRAALMFINQHKPNIFCLLEPKVFGIGADEIYMKLKYNNWIRVEAVGFSGGIWIFWNDEIHVRVECTHPQAILIEVEDCRNCIWHFAAVYASPTPLLRQKLWRMLKADMHSISNPWLVAGDFNSVTNMSEVSNPETFSSTRCSGFNNWIFEEGMIDLGFTGPNFTWMRGKVKDSFKGARLDRALCSTDWLDCFKNTKVVHLPAYCSDHAPLLISFDEENHKVRNTFKFQAAWTLHSEFSSVVQSNWDNNQSILSNTKHLAQCLRRWNRNSFGNIHAHKRRMLARLEGIQNILGKSHHTGLIKLENKIRGQLEDVLKQEELLWFQQSREEWIRSGDRNTKFYHAATRVRKVTNRTTRLKDNYGNWVVDTEGMKNLVYQHFTRIFSRDTNGTEGDEMIANFPQLNNERWDWFNADFTPDEVKKAIFDMSPYKAPGPDGFHAGFYQKSWATVGNVITKQTLDFLNSGVMEEGLNDTLVTLLPKVNNPEEVAQFRPISLCNVSYKVITKVMTNRIKGILNDLIGLEQSSFVPGRQITNNVIIYQEALHSMRNKKGNVGWMAWKIDLEKAYDRISWDFIRDSLYRAGFNSDWIRNVMGCVETAKLAPIWNGEQLDWITPSRGIRQGDAISPYLFVICIERLSHLINDSVHNKRWKGIKLSKYGPTITHLFFADDMVLFSEATEQHVQIIKDCLERFSAASGQKISLSKSQIFFSKNVSQELANKISGIAGINTTNNLGKYLGVPSIHGRVTNSLFTPLLDKISKRLEGWKMKFLTLAGRQVLVQSVLASIPYYAMQSTLLPVGVCDSIDQKIRNFLWGGDASKRNCHLVCWDQITKPKEEGGLGIRPAKDMNKAFLAKLAWRMLSEDESLWARVLRSKYASSEGGADGIIHRHNASNAWRGIVEAKPILLTGLRHVAGNGRSIKFWKDVWIEDMPLQNLTGLTADYLDIEATVADYWRPGRGWAWDMLPTCLPSTTCDKMHMYVLSERNDDKDEISWQHESSGKFTVQSAYRHTHMSILYVQDTGWRKIWKLNVPNKIICFLWLVKHGKILCNAERRRRGFTDNDRCPNCMIWSETVEHLLRSCDEASAVWRRLLPRYEINKLMNVPFQHWLNSNLNGKVKSGFGTDWPDLFAIVLWWLWKWRNDKVFNNLEREAKIKSSWVLRYWNEIKKAFDCNEAGAPQVGTYREIDLRWQHPERGIIALNVDGSFTADNGIAGG